MGMPRRVEPEWLDELPPDDPRARRSRRDLVRINALMGNRRIVARALRRAGKLGTVAEIGAGEGTLLLGEAEALSPAWGGARVFLVDRQALVREETLRRFAGAGCIAHAVQSDAFRWLADARTPSFDVIVANLFLHHFKADELQELLGLIARRTRSLIACEPRRCAVAMAGARLLGAVGCNAVSRHDAVVSVRAGFRDRELTALWPRDGSWDIDERARGLFSHGFVAWRAAP
jgi:hypothetical protein